MSRIHYRITIFEANTRWIHYFFGELRIYLLFFSRSDYLSIIFSPISLVFREITLISLSISQIYYEVTLFPRLTIFVAQTLTIDYLCRELTIDSLSVTRIHHESIIVSAYYLSVTQIDYDFMITLSSLLISRIKYSLSFSQNQNEFTFCYAKSVWIHYLCPELTMNGLFFSPIAMYPVPFSWNNDKFTIFFAKTLSTIIFVANQLWYYSLLRVFTINTSSFSRFIICIAYSLWIHYLFPKIHSEFIIHYFNIFFVKILWIHFQFRKFTIFLANWLCINYILHWITMNQLSFFGKTLSIRYLCRVFVIFHPNLPWIREKNINIPSFSQNHYEFIISQELIMVS